MSNNIFQAILACKKEIPEIEKKAIAKVRMKSGGEYSYKYADLADVQRNIKAPMDKHGLVFMHNIVREDGKEILKTRLIHVETKEQEVSSLEIPPGQFQERGASITYAKRYNICALLDLSLDEDIDGPPKAPNEPKAQNKPQGPPPPAPQEPKQTNSELMTVKQGKYLWVIAKKHGWDEARIKQFMKVRFQIESTKQLTRFNFDILLSAIEKSPLVEATKQ